MRYVFQLLDQRNGGRSPVVVANRAEFAKAVDAAFPEHDRSSFLVLVLYESSDADDAPISDGDWSRAPLISLQRFIDEFCVKEVQLNG